MEDELQALLEDDLDDSAFAYAVASIMACCEKTGPLALWQGLAGSYVVSLGGGRRE